MDPAVGDGSTQAHLFEPRDYSDWFDTELGRRVWNDERAVLLPMLGDLDGREVLDAGVGEARLALEVTRAGGRVTGVDLARDMLRFARNRARHAHLRLPLAAGRLESLPFRTGSFDVVVAMTVLCFVPVPSVAVREMARVLRPGGRLVLGELGRWSLWAAKRRVSGLLGDARWQDVRFWTPSSLERLLRESGLDPCRRGAAVFYPPSALAARLLQPLERILSGGPTALGAAFVAAAAEKP